MYFANIPAGSIIHIYNDRIIIFVFIKVFSYNSFSKSSQIILMTKGQEDEHFSAFASRSYIFIYLQ